MCLKSLSIIFSSFYWTKYVTVEYIQKGNHVYERLKRLDLIYNLYKDGLINK